MLLCFYVPADKMLQKKQTIKTIKIKTFLSYANGILFFLFITLRLNHCLSNSNKIKDILPKPVQIEGDDIE